MISKCVKVATSFRNLYSNFVATFSIGNLGCFFESELQLHVVRIEAEALNSGSFPTKPQVVAANDLSPSVNTNVASFDGEGKSKKCLLKWKGPKNINRIYADWLDDLPLGNNLPSKVEG